MADCQTCRAFIRRTMTRDYEWVKKATDEELKRADSEIIEYHCPKCKNPAYVIALVRPK